MFWINSNIYGVAEGNSEMPLSLMQQCELWNISHRGYCPSYQAKLLVMFDSSWSGLNFGGGGGLDLACGP